MGGFLLAPAFNPPQPPIPVGTVGQVLTVQAGGGLKFAAGGGGPALGTSITYASPSGANNNVAPAGFGAGVGAILVTLAGGNSTWTGLTAGAEGQTVTVINTDPANSLTLDNLNAGSSAANQFQGVGNFVLPPNNRVVLQYRGGLNSGAGAWSMG